MKPANPLPWLPGVFRRVGRIALFASLLLPLAAISGEKSRSDADPVLATGRELSQLFLAGQTDALWQRMTASMRAALKSQEAFAAFRQQVESQLGTEEKVLSERTDLVQGAQVYRRHARWSKMASAITMRWDLDADGRVVGFRIQPEAAPEPAPSAYLDYRTRANLRLPFDGEWFVVWGGRTLQQNHHAANRGQRFAYDLLRLEQGESHRGSGRALDDYYCWDQKILAPADARVVDAVDGVPDQAIGTTNAEQPAGNHVILDLGNDEYALLAHLRQGTVRVSPGDRVSAGAELGRCGNSGNTSEPHLHFHLQNQPRFGEGDGLPAFFSHYVADGKPVRNGEPLQGQRVADSGGKGDASN